MDLRHRRPSIQDPPVQEQDLLRSRLIDVEGRLARFLLSAVQKQASYDADYVERSTQPRTVKFFYGSLFIAVLNLINFTLYVHSITVVFATDRYNLTSQCCSCVMTLYFVCVNWFGSLKPLKSIFDILFPEAAPGEVNLILMATEVIVYFLIMVIALSILNFAWLLYILGIGQIQDMAVNFGLAHFLHACIFISVTILVILLRNHDELARSIVGQIAMHGLDENTFNAYDMVQYELQCCGFENNANDWLRGDLMNWTEPMTGNHYNLHNRFEYLVSCNPDSWRACRAPNSCCTDFNVVNQQNGKALECVVTNYQKSRFDDVRRFFPKDLTTEMSGMHKQGCAIKLSEQLDSWFSVSVLMMFFTFCTMLINGVVHTVLIAQVDGLGVIDPLSERVTQKNGLSIFDLGPGLDAANTVGLIYGDKADDLTDITNVIKQAALGLRHPSLDCHSDESDIQMINVNDMVAVDI